MTSQINEPHLRTSDAARFLTGRGKQTSVSLLRKLRTKGADDPGDHGPSWVRAPNGDCLYPVSSLEQYLADYHAKLRPMAAMEAPSAALEAAAERRRSRRDAA
jgi:hypothetical protein